MDPVRVQRTERRRACGSARRTSSRPGNRLRGLGRERRRHRTRGGRRLVCPGLAARRGGPPPAAWSARRRDDRAVRACFSDGIGHARPALEKMRLVGPVARGLQCIAASHMLSARWNVVGLRRSTDFSLQDFRRLPAVLPWASSTARGALQPHGYSSTHVKACKVVWCTGVVVSSLCTDCSRRPPAGAGPIQPNRYQRPRQAEAPSNHALHHLQPANCHATPLLPRHQCLQILRSEKRWDFHRFF
jgi:hypothetical protein